MCGLQFSDHTTDSQLEMGLGS